MALSSSVHTNGQDIVLLPVLIISTAISATATTPVKGLAGMKYLVVQAVFLYGSGGTTANAYVQTTLDGGVSWIDIMNFSFTTATAVKISACTTSIAPATQANAPTDGSLTANTIVQGILGNQLRVKYVTTGTYAGATALQLTATAKG